MAEDRISKNGQKAKCSECGAWYGINEYHGLRSPGHAEYVGPCTSWVFGKDEYGLNAEWQCGAPGTDTCDYCDRPMCDSHMEIKRYSGR